ncbi:MAG: 1-phosphofructokinase [Cyanobacteria bacterium J06607_13]
MSIATVTLNPAIDQTVSVPNFAADAVNRVEWAQADPGGKGINVSSFLADYGISTTATGFLGRGNSAPFKQLFQQKGIGDQCLRLPGNTRVNIKIIDDAQQQVTDLNFPGLSPAENDLQALKERISQLAKTHDWFILAGSLPAQVPVDIYRELTQMLKQQGKHVALDTSGPPLKVAIASTSPKPDFIKPNLVELQELLGQSLTAEADIVSAARELVTQGISRVAVSMGEAGALFVDATEAIRAQADAPTVKSTVGAGDAMVAGTLAAWSQGHSLTESARLGTAFSLGALSQIGPRLPPKSGLLQHQACVTLRAVEPAKTTVSLS